MPKVGIVRASVCGAGSFLDDLETVQKMTGIFFQNDKIGKESPYYTRNSSIGKRNSFF